MQRFIPPVSYVEWKRRRLETIVQEFSGDDRDDNGSGAESGGGVPKEKAAKGTRVDKAFSDPRKSNEAGDGERHLGRDSR